MCVLRRIEQARRFFVQEVCRAHPEQTGFTVVLTDPRRNKVNTIKAVRELTGLGLREPKELVDNLPESVKEGVSRDEAEGIRKKFAGAGATAVVRTDRGFY